jgi:hypothetical protein
MIAVSLLLYQLMIRKDRPPSFPVFACEASGKQIELLFWKYTQEVPPKRRCPPTRLHDIAIHKLETWTTITEVKSELKLVLIYVYFLLRRNISPLNSFSRHVPAATNTHATLEEQCFLLGPCREFITQTVGAMRSVEFCNGGWKEMAI